MQTTILFIFGTRPEAIKLSPLIHEFKKNEKFKTLVAVTAQHREMLDQVLNFFNITPDYDLNLMKENQSLEGLTINLIEKVSIIVKKIKPNYIFIQGDTTSTFIGALTAYYNKIQICHIEAGLRTFNKYSPWPEEGNRLMTTQITDYHFAPTENNRSNLLNENISGSRIYVTGNTVIDALFMSLKLLRKGSEIQNNILKKFVKISRQIESKKIVLITLHRRENFGNRHLGILKAIRSLSNNYTHIQFVFPVHPNPNIRNCVAEVLSNTKNVHLIDPLAYHEFVYLMSRSYLILTDSGGVQEEAPALGIPTFVLRENTERPEALSVGNVKLLGFDEKNIFNEINKVLSDKNIYKKMRIKKSAYGDGKASKRILKYLLQLRVIK